jgi:hypothetical protein
MLATSCAPSQGVTAPPEPTSAAGLKPVATIKEIMDNIVDPNADELWDSVATTIDITGVHERYPRTDEEWKKVRNNALALIEAPNLLMMTPRQVAGPGDRSQNPGIELQPEEIQKLIDDDRATFNKLALDLQTIAIEALKAIDAKDKDRLSDVGGPIDHACEQCHLKYWYPNETQTRTAPPLTPEPSHPPVGVSTEKKSADEKKGGGEKK